MLRWKVTVECVLRAETEADANKAVLWALESTGWDTFLVDSVADEDEANADN